MMAKKKGWIAWLMAIWISFINDILLLALGSALAFGGLTIPLFPDWVRLSVGWSVLVISAVSLVLWAISFIQGLLKRLS